MSDDKRLALQSALQDLVFEQPFYGAMLSQLNIKYTTNIPLACISYSPKEGTFDITLNQERFPALSRKERAAVLQHEILHFSHKHIFKAAFLINNPSPEDAMTNNIAMDMEINQLIKGLPEDCVDVADFKMSDGTQFPVLKDMLVYDSLIKDEKQKQQKKQKEGSNKGNVLEKLASYKPMDSHDWEQLDEEQKKKMLEEAKKLVKRSIDKISHMHSTVPESVRDLLAELDTLTDAIDHKRILQHTIKKTVTSVDREKTWKRPNKRYGVYSPGSKQGSLPHLCFMADTSGSISAKELNEALRVTDEFLRAGVRDCMLGLWHTDLYYIKKYKVGAEIDKTEIEIGGTDLTATFKYIKENKPDLCIILTDGYYDKVDVDVTSEVLFIISDGGNKDHPMNHVGKTIYLENLR